MSSIAHKTRAISLRREASCKWILHLRSFENEGFVRQFHEAQVHVFSDSVLRMGKQAMNEPETNFTKRWNDCLEQLRGSTTRIDGEHIFGAKTNDLSSSSSFHNNDERNPAFFNGIERM